MGKSSNVSVEQGTPDRAPEEPGDRDFVTALARGLRILQAFRSGEERLSNADLAHRCQLPRSTVTRLTRTLTAVGFLHQVEELGRYRLGLATLTLGRSMLVKLDFRDANGELLQQLANETGAMVALGIREDLSVLYIDTHRSQSTAVTLNLGIGSRLPLLTTAMGRAHILMMDSPERAVVLERLKALNFSSGVNVEDVVRQARMDMEKWKCVTSFGDWKHEINGIAVPLDIGDELNRVVVNVAAPTRTMTSEQFLTEVRPRLLAIKHRIEIDHRRI